MYEYLKYTKQVYILVFWSSLLFSATDLWILVTSVALTTLLTTFVLLVILIIVQDAGATISESVFHIFWGIISYFTNCNIRLPNIDEVSFEGTVPSPEQDTVRHFGAILLLSRDKHEGGFIFWIASVAFLMFYFSAQSQLQSDASLFSQQNAEDFDVKVVRVFPKVLLALTLLSAHTYTGSPTFTVLLIVTTVLKTKPVFHCLTDNFRRLAFSSRQGRGEETIYAISIILSAFTTFLAVHLTKRDVISPPVFLFCLETLFFKFKMCKQIRGIYLQRSSLFRNTEPCSFSTKEEKLECAICLSQMKSGRITSCNHKFHTRCLEILLQTSEKCPICRANIH